MADMHTKDLTTGSPMKLILSFMLPLVFGLLFQQVYSMVDTIVVGKFLGVDALAGVGSTGSITFLVLGLCNGVCAGFAIPVAQKFGQRDFDGLRRFVGNMIWLGCVIAAAVTLVTTLLCRQILLWMDTPADTFSYAYDYIFVIFLGIPATMLYNLLSGILRSLGDSKTPLVFLIMCSLLNVALDIVFILTLNMGVAGAGWATLLSQLISGVLCLYFIVKKFPILHLKQDDLRLRKIYVRKLLNMGLPMGLQYSITAVGSILLQTAVNGLGATAMAAIAAGSRVSMLLGNYRRYLRRTESGRGEAGSDSPGDQGLHGTGHYHLRCDFCDHLVWRQCHDHTVPGYGGRGERRHGGADGTAVPADQCGVCHSAAVRQSAPLHHSGVGLLGVCGVRGSVRDGGQRRLRALSGAGAWLYSRMLCQPCGMGDG